MHSARKIVLIGVEVARVVKSVHATLQECMI